MEDFKLVFLENSAFENLDICHDNIFSTFDLSRIGSDEETYALKGQCCARGKSFPKIKENVLSPSKWNIYASRFKVHIN